VLQALARVKLLGQFHYLSSVSGGGYIASWFTTWRNCKQDEVVLPALNESLSTGREPPEIVGIRKDSNYLTPKLGLLSADTWTVVTLYFRNLLLNWIMFLPFFMGCLMFPRLCVALLIWVSDVSCPACVFDAARAFGVLFVLIGLSVAIYGRFRKQDKWLTNGRFLWMVLAPLIASGASFCVAAVVAGASHEASFASAFREHHIYDGLICGAAIYFSAWAIGRFLSRAFSDESGERIEPLDVFIWILSGAVVGLIISLEMSQIAAGITIDTKKASPAAVTLGLSGFVTAYLLGELLYVGLASFARNGDMDREWLARASGWLSAAAVAWATISGIALYAPFALQTLKLRAVSATLGAASGLVTLLLGSSTRTTATKAAEAVKNVPYMRIASAAAVLFAVLITSFLALGDETIECALISIWKSPTARLVIDSMLIFVPIGVAFLLSYAINVNRFSLHALYRNRLVRAFPGSARAGVRQADPFTSFDPKDNIPLAKSKPKESTDRLFHIINTALNVVASNNPAWQERKAESFTMSRLHCGNPFVYYRRTQFYGGLPAGGLSLGTAMAISGAAVSPNQGYNSSPLIGFLLMLFNIRLGWWLGSPRSTDYFREGPKYSLTPALRELAGDTTDKSRWIYLSDGGHFENLGLYEMVRRRCRIIIVSDAGCDKDCTFEDLGNAVRKIYIDFGVSIDFEKLEIRARQNPAVSGARFAIGTITYPGSGPSGWLLYIKPTYQGTERADVRSYAAGSPAFPHESTTDQWFSESQLESYRALGACITEYICDVETGRSAPDMTFKALKESIARRLRKQGSDSAGEAPG
jgi:hypothetical protein